MSGSKELLHLARERQMEAERKKTECRPHKFNLAAARNYYVAVCDKCDRVVTFNAAEWYERGLRDGALK